MGQPRHMVELGLLRKLTNPFYSRRVELLGGNFSLEEALRVECEIARLEEEGDEPIVLIIDSSRNGIGQSSRAAADHLFRVIQSSRVEIWGFVVGTCRLSAMYVLQACNYRLAVKTATLQFHDLRRVLTLDIFHGDDLSRILMMVARILVKTYFAVEGERRAVAQKLEKRNPHLPEGLILSLMKDEVEFTAEEALDLRIIDLVVEYQPAVH